MDRRARSGYPSYTGAPEFRRAAADWTSRRFGVELDPGREICATIGSKEAVFNLAKGFVDPGDVVLVTSPGYPPATRGARWIAATAPRPLQARNDSTCSSVGTQATVGAICCSSCTAA